MQPHPGPESRGRRRGVASAATAGLCLVLLLVGACSTPRAATPDRAAAPRPPSSAPMGTAGIEPTVAPAESPAETRTVQEPAPLRAFSVSRVLADTRAIERFGIRIGGGAAERRAADFVADRLRSMGYDVSLQDFSVPGGVSRNVTARVRGDDARLLVLGAHLDTRSMTPGANDDAAGCAIVLEIARILADEKPPVSVEFTLFGSEEYNDGARRDHHRGSRFRVARMTKAQRARVIGMISVDVVGYGRDLYVRTMDIGPRSMSDYLLYRAEQTGVRLRYLKDPGPTGWSDHEPYEKAGIPAVWLERLQDPQYHKPGDTTAHLQTPALRESGRLVLDAVRSLDAAQVRRITGRDQGRP